MHAFPARGLFFSGKFKVGQVTRDSIIYPRKKKMTHNPIALYNPLALYLQQERTFKCLCPCIKLVQFAYGTEMARDGPQGCRSHARILPFNSVPTSNHCCHPVLHEKKSVNTWCFSKDSSLFMPTYDINVKTPRILFAPLLLGGFTVDDLMHSNEGDLSLRKCSLSTTTVSVKQAFSKANLKWSTGNRERYQREHSGFTTVSHIPNNSE